MNENSNRQIDYDSIKISISDIVSALHQKALAACDKKYRITNSAMSGDGNSAKLKFSGEQIISVISTEENKKIKVFDAIDQLKKYVKAFAGPDESDKIDEETVHKLKAKTEAVSETKLMTFEEFLLNEQKHSFKPSDVNFLNEDDSDSDNSDEALGWFITYELKAGKLKLKDHSILSSLRDLGRAWFDGITFTASGIFGGGKTIAGKDIRKKVHDALHVDPEKLAQNVRAYIDKKYPSNENHIIVDHSRSEILVNELGSQLSKAQKKTIGKSKFALTIKVKEEDDRKPLFNVAKIAQIIRKSISSKRLFKKMALGPNKIIKIENYKDDKDSESKANNAKRPSQFTIYTEISKELVDFRTTRSSVSVPEKQAARIISNLEKQFNKLTTNIKAMREVENKKAVALFADLKKQIEASSSITYKTFQDFFTKYKKFEDSLNESAVICIDLDQLFESVLHLNEAGTGDPEIEEKIRSIWKNYVGSTLLGKKTIPLLMTKDKALDQLKNFTDFNDLKTELDSNKKFTHVLVVDLNEKSNLTESIDIEQQLMSYLFEAVDDDMLQQIKDAHDNGMKYPFVLDVAAGTKRELDFAEVKTLLANGAIGYDKEKNKIVVKREKTTFNNIVTGKDVDTEIDVDKFKHAIKDILDTLQKNADLQDYNIGNINVLKSQLVESAFSYGNLIVDSASMLLEKKNKAALLKSALKPKLEYVLQHKDDILKKAFTDSKTNQLFHWANPEEFPKRAENEGYNAFVQAIFGHGSDVDKINDGINAFEKHCNAKNSSFNYNILTRFLSVIEKIKDSEGESPDEEPGKEGKPPDEEPGKETGEKYIVKFYAVRDPNAEKLKFKVIEVDGSRLQLVAKGASAKRPADDDVPKFNGYEFAGWGDAEDKLMTVDSNVYAVTHYKKINYAYAFAVPVQIVTSDKMPFNHDDAPVAPQDDETDSKFKYADLYIYPITRAEKFETDAKDTED